MLPSSHGLTVTGHARGLAYPHARGRVADGKMVMVHGFFVIFTILKTIDDDDGNTVIELQGWQWHLHICK